MAARLIKTANRINLRTISIASNLFSFFSNFRLNIPFVLFYIWVNPNIESTSEFERRI